MSAVPVQQQQRRARKTTNNPNNTNNKRSTATSIHTPTVSTAPNVSTPTVSTTLTTGGPPRAEGTTPPRTLGNDALSALCATGVTNSPNTPNTPSTTGQDANIYENKEKNVAYIIDRVKDVYKEEYDISDATLAGMVTPDVVKEFLLVYEQYYFDLKYTTAKDIDISNLTLDSTNELCGHIKKIEPNGVRTFCNVHKHLHYNDVKDHMFVQKTEQNIRDENKQNITLKNTKKFFHMFADYVYKRIKRNMLEQYVPNYFVLPQKCLDTPDKLSTVFDWLKQWVQSNAPCFKSKYVKTVLLDDPNIGKRGDYYVEVFLPTLRTQGVHETTVYVNSLKQLHERFV